MRTMTNNLLKNLTAAFVIVFTVGVSGAWAEEIEFKKNPNNLPLCPSPDLSKQKDLGSEGRTWRWNNCFGRYSMELNEYELGSILEGEWQSGLLNGKGSYAWSGKNKGQIYFGDFKLGKSDGYGVSILADGKKYIGEFKNGNLAGQGVYYFPDGQIWEGIWENNNFIKKSKINLPNINNNQTSKNEISPSFACKKAKSISEKLICSDGELSALDRELSNYHIQAKLLITDKEFFKKEHEAAWIKREKECMDKQCLFAWYASRKSHYNKIISESKVNLANTNANQATDAKNINIERERQQLVEERRKFEEEKRNREQARNNQRINLQVTNTQANAEGDFVINIQTGTDTASLKINGEEQGGKQDGSYSIKRVARAGQTTQFTIIAKDIYGNSDSKTISVTRQITASNTIKYAELNPALVKTQPNKDAVAIIIGIADYKNLPRADYANDDARVFYDYAIRGLGVKAENIKLLVDADAGQGEILKTFKTWLPSRVKSTTDIYVYYSGHGLPSADGQTLYLLPQLADRDLIEDTAVAQSRINAAIQAAKPKSVTIFLDSCYSGAARTGQTLLASARPISLKANTQTFPPDFTVFTASTAEQISSSSPDLKHGIFSYYLMRGMEGEVDTNKDGKITAGEMQAYLTENVAKQASIANRVQQPQLTGDANRVLVGK